MLEQNGVPRPVKMLKRREFAERTIHRPFSMQRSMSVVVIKLFTAFNGNFSSWISSSMCETILLATFTNWRIYFSDVFTIWRWPSIDDSHIRAVPRWSWSNVAVEHINYCSTRQDLCLCTPYSSRGEENWKMAFASLSLALFAKDHFRMARRVWKAVMRRCANYFLCFITKLRDINL